MPRQPLTPKEVVILLVEAELESMWRNETKRIEIEIAQEADRALDLDEGREC